MEFHFLQTDDQSPSLKLGPNAEPMHNSKGAFSETVYIYGHAIQTAIENSFEPKFLSLGLGLGYNELVAVSMTMKANTKNVCGESFEAVPELTNYFLSWLRNAALPTEFEVAYEQICGLCAEHFGLDKTKIKERLRTLHAEGNWKFRESLGLDTKFTKKFSCFLFDAFSSKTSPELWTEEFLEAFLKRSSDDSAVLSTYACTGTLKRALIKNDFLVETRAGFGGKRDSTFALRRRKSP